VVIRLALADGLSVELPLARVEESLRPLAHSDEIDPSAWSCSDAALELGPWLKRQRAARAKAGPAVGRAEILSAGAQRRTQHRHGSMSSWLGLTRRCHRRSLMPACPLALAAWPNIGRAIVALRLPLAS
jgi:hypothetical protein